MTSHFFLVVYIIYFIGMHVSKKLAVTDVRKSHQISKSQLKSFESYGEKTKGEKLRNPGPNWVKTQNMTFQAFLSTNAAFSE